jgi:hypothetical protein
VLVEETFSQGADMSFSHQSSSSSPAFGAQRKKIATGLDTAATGITGAINPVLTGELDNPITAAEQNALTQTAMQPEASAFDAAGNQISQTAARTRNPAGLLESEEQLAQKKGEALSGAAENALLSGMKIGDTRRSDALKLLAQQYGIDLDTLSRLLSGQNSKSSGFGLSVSGSYNPTTGATSVGGKG